LHYIFPGIIARVANKSSGYERIGDLAGGHSVPQVGYDGFADGRFEGFGLIVDFNPHAATGVTSITVAARSRIHSSSGKPVKRQGRR
jgi:hypothetical protein